MDVAEAASPGVGAWAAIRGYFTPATLFLVVNIVIGTIALTSRTHQRRRRQVYQYHHDGEILHHDQLQPPPPLLHQQYYGGGEHQQMMMQETLYAPPPAPAPLARTSSVLDRLRSFGLYRFRSGDFPPEYATAAAAATSQLHHQRTEEVVSSSPVDEVKLQGHYARSRSEPAAAPAQEERKAASRLRNSSSEVRRAEVVRAPARVVEAFPEEAAVAVDATAEDDFTPKQQRDLPLQQEYVPPPAPAPAPLARTSSVLDRLRSFTLYSFRSGDLATDDIPADAAAAATPAQAHYGRTRSEPAREQNKKAKKQAASEAKTMTKSSSEARKDTAAEDADDGGVDARADDFINKFRQQLQLQRLNSLLNYKEMLNRGSSKQ